MNFNDKIKELVMPKTVEDLLQTDFVKNSNGKVVLAFNGVMSQDSIIGLGEVLRSELHHIHPLSIVNKIFAIFIEMTQNVLHYSFLRAEINGKSIGKGIVLVFSTETGYSLLTANLVNEKQQSNLKDKCEHVNSLNEDQIKEHYLNRRRRLAEGDSKGAGLGFYDIVRRSGMPVDYAFETTSDQQHYWYMLRSNFMLNK
jgi:hypothetical protein